MSCGYQLLVLGVVLRRISLVASVVVAFGALLLAHLTLVTAVAIAIAMRLGSVLAAFILAAAGWSVLPAEHRALEAWCSAHSDRLCR